MILNAIAEKLKRQSKDDFKGRHFEAWLIVQAVTWYLRYPLSYRDLEEMFRERGFDGIGVGDLTRAAGFTHGGFYNHFKSKDALAADSRGVPYVIVRGRRGGSAMAVAAVNALATEVE